MTQEQVFGLLADVAKRGVESSAFSRDEKERRKADIDLIADLLKTGLPPKNPFGGQTIQIPFEYLQSMKESAKAYHLRRVTYLWIPTGDGNASICMLVEGENAQPFMNQFGFRFLNSFSGLSQADMDAVEKYGIILYEAPDLLTRT